MTASPLRVGERRLVVDGTGLWRQSLGARGPLDDRAPAVAGLAVHPVGHEVAVGLAAATGSPRLVVIAAGQALATELAGEPLRYDSTGDIVALVAPAADPGRRLVRTTRRPFASGVDGPPIDELYADTLRFDAAGATLTYFALVEGNLVFVRQPDR